MNARVTAGIVAALVLAGAVVISFVSFAPTKSPEAMAAATPSSTAPSVLPEAVLPAAAAPSAAVIPAAYSTAMMSGCDVEIQAVNGTISDLVGDVTKYSARLWTVQRSNLTLVVEESDNVLTVHFPDETPDTVIEFLAGSASDFMDMLAADPACGECSSMPCCITNCEEGSQLMCWCQAHVSCASLGGVHHFCFNPATGQCEYTCVN